MSKGGCIRTGECTDKAKSVSTDLLSLRIYMADDHCSKPLTEALDIMTDEWLDKGNDCIRMIQEMRDALKQAITITTKYRDALRLISVEAACDGPGCPYCEREDEIHPFTAVAKVAQEALR